MGSCVLPSEKIWRSTRAPRPSTRYDPTHWETGSLASQETTRSVASIRRRHHLCEELETSLRREQLIATQLEAHRKLDTIRRALRNEENLADNDDVLSSCSHPKNAIPAWIEQQPQTTATHVSADLLPHSPTPPSARDHPEPKMKPDRNQKKKSPPQTDKSSSQLPMPVRVARNRDWAAVT